MKIFQFVSSMGFWRVSVPFFLFLSCTVANELFKKSVILKINTILHQYTDKKAQNEVTFLLKKHLYGGNKKMLNWILFFFLFVLKIYLLLGTTLRNRRSSMSLVMKKKKTVRKTSENFIWISLIDWFKKQAKFDVISDEKKENC